MQRTFKQKGLLLAANKPKRLGARRSLMSVKKLITKHQRGSLNVR